MNLEVLAGASLLMQGSRFSGAIQATKNPGYLLRGMVPAFKTGLEVLPMADFWHAWLFQNKFPAKSVARHAVACAESCAMVAVAANDTKNHNTDGKLEI